MGHFKGACPVCKNVFKSEDDIVICPECGAPYHRDCYAEEGQCVYTEQHGPAFDYDKDILKKAEKTPESSGSQGEKQDTASNVNGSTGQNTAGEKAITCRRCGTVNQPGTIFCVNCGLPLHGRTPTQQGQAGPGQARRAQVSMGGQIEGIDNRDWARFIGKSAPNYLYRMSMMQRSGSKMNFMFSAFFVTPFYFAYRKMWGWSALATGMYLISWVLQVFGLAAAEGLTILPGLSSNALSNAYLISNFVFLAIRIVFGFMSTYLYQRHGVKQINKARTENPDEIEYQNALVKKGGVSTFGPVLIGVILLLFSTAMVWYLGEDFVSALMSALGM